MSTGALVPFPTTGEKHDQHDDSCPVCGRRDPGHPVPPQVHRQERISLLPEGLGSVLARTGEVSRRARAAREAEERRCTDLALYLTGQLESFNQAMEQAGVTAPGLVRVRRHGRRVRAVEHPAWSIRHWRSALDNGLPRSRHLYLTPEGRCVESADDPGLATAWNAAPAGEFIELREVFLRMGSVDARQATQWVIAALADLMKEHGAAI